MKQRKSWVGWWLCLVLLLAVCALWPTVAGSPGYAQASDGFKVIVNVSNPTAEMSQKQLERVFLKKQQKWPNGFGITVVDQNVYRDMDCAEVEYNWDDYRQRSPSSPSGIGGDRSLNPV